MHSLYPALALLVSLCFPLSAQVGVNNPTPEQALDVDGKVKISDDATPPSDGTVRYNDGEGTFEGFTDGEWEAFNKSATPTDVEIRHLRFWDLEPSSFSSEYRLIGRTPAVGVNGSSGTWNEDGLQRNINSGGVLVPPGKFFMVDKITVTGLGGATGFFSVRVAETSSTSTDPTILPQNPIVYLSGSTANGVVTMQANHVPLLIVRPNNNLCVLNDERLSTTNVAIQVYGILVDDPDEYYGQ